LRPLVCPQRIEKRLTQKFFPPQLKGFVNICPKWAGEFRAFDKGEKRLLSYNVLEREKYGPFKVGLSPSCPQVVYFLLEYSAFPSEKRRNLWSPGI